MIQLTLQPEKGVVRVRMEGMGKRGVKEKKLKEKKIESEICNISIKIVIVHVEYRMTCGHQAQRAD